MGGGSSLGLGNYGSKGLVMVHSSNLLTTLSQYFYVNTALLHVNDSR